MKNCFLSSQVRRNGAVLPLSVGVLRVIAASLLLGGCNQTPPVTQSTTPEPITAASTKAPTVSASPAPVASPSPIAAPTTRQPVTLTEPVRGIYISGWVTGGTTRWKQLLNVVDTTDINSVVIDVKEDGMMSYATDIPLAVAVNANQKMVPDIDAKLAELQKHKIFSIARITCFRDQIVARKRPDLAVQHPDGSPWRDRSGHYWLDPYNKENWDYNVAVAIDAAKRGFGEVQWDYVRFPSEGAKSGRRYPAKAKDDQRSEARVIADFLKYAREKLKPYHVPISSDIFGLTVSAKPDDDMGIGQKIDLIIPNVDVICPMIYPSHYGRGEYNIAYPNAAPYRTITHALRDGVKRIKGTNCKIRPWLQDFSLGVRYGVPEVRAQIKAAREQGVNEYLLWNASNRYTTAALTEPKPKPSKSKGKASPAVSRDSKDSKTPLSSATPLPTPSPAPSAKPSPG